MGYLALTMHRTGCRRWGRGRTRGGKVGPSVVCTLLLLLGGAGLQEAQSQTGYYSEPPLPSLPATPYVENLPPPAEYYPVDNGIQITPSITPRLPAGTKSVPASNLPGAKFGPGYIGAPAPEAQPGELPQPKLVPPFQKGHIPLACPPGTLGAVPVASPETQTKLGKYIDQMVDTEATMDLVVGRTRLMKLRSAPKRIQIADDTVAGYTIIAPTQISLLGKMVGVTVLTMWFTAPDDPNREEILTYHVRVYPDPEARQRLEQVYHALAKEINCLFPDSNVCLKLVGDKIAVTGFAHDVEQAAKILQIVRTNAPDPRDPRPAAARIPVDRIGVTGLPGEVVPVTLEQYEVMGGPNVINLLKVTGEQQVMLRVTVAEVNRAAARSIGLNFSILNNQGIAVFANNTGSIATGGLTPMFQGGGSGGGLGFINFASGNTFGIPPFPGFPAGAGGFNNLPAALDNGQIRLAISALKNLNYARSLAEPTLVTMNGQLANFQAGGQFPVPIVTGTTFAGLQGVSFVPFGVSLNFTPFITDRDRIRLVIAAEVSSRDLSAGVTNIGGAGVPSLTTRNFNTTVELREGQTLAVAGLIQNNLGADASRIPFFGELPVLSRLLGFDRITAGEQELVVLITPELVHPMEHYEVPPLPGSDVFEPTDLEFYLLGRIEGHRPLDYRSPVRTDWHRLHRHYESLYLFGPHGYVDH